ncbi:MAG: thioesterase family protein [Chloroflexi bacterium]|nr:thioesterase family protein [Chloroflexota bacterium]
MASADRFVSEISFHVRYAETDKMGIVHHAAYLVWFEEGRSAYMRDQGFSYAAVERAGHFLAAGELEAKYLMAARYDQEITVRTWIADYRSRTVSFACEIVDALSGERLFKARLKLVCLDSGGRIVRLPAAWSAWLGPSGDG